MLYCILEQSPAEESSSSANRQRAEGQGLVRASRVGRGKLRILVEIFAGFNHHWPATQDAKAADKNLELSILRATLSFAYATLSFAYAERSVLHTQRSILHTVKFKNFKYLKKLLTIF